MQRRRGFTLIEILVVLAILGIAFAITLSSLRMPSATLYANDLKAMIQQARFEAIKRNVAVAVVWDGADEAFEMRVNEEDDRLCTATNVIKTHSLSEYRSLSLTTDLPGNGIIWIPTGQITNCTGGLLNDTATTISDSRNTLQVVLSRAGKVTIE